MVDIQNIFASSTGNAVETITSLPLDTTVLAIVFLVLFIYSMKYGKRAIISLIFSLYISIPIISFFPYSESISFLGDTTKALVYSQIILFILVVILTNITIKRVISWELYQRGLRKLTENIFLAIVSGGFLIAIFYHIIDI